MACGCAIKQWRWFLKTRWNTSIKVHQNHTKLLTRHEEPGETWFGNDADEWTDAKNSLPFSSSRRLRQAAFGFKFRSEKYYSK